MPLLDHFHPPLRGPRRWEGFHHAWATSIAQHLNQDVLPDNYFAELEISLGPALEFDVATLEQGRSGDAMVANSGVSTVVWAPTQPAITAPLDFARLDVCEVRVFEELGGAQLREAIELVSPSNKDRPGSRRTFAAGYLTHGVALVIIDVVTERSANLHTELWQVLEICAEPVWQAATGLYAIAYRPVAVLDRPRIEAWPESLALANRSPRCLSGWPSICACRSRCKTPTPSRAPRCASASRPATLRNGAEISSRIRRTLTRRDSAGDGPGRLSGASALPGSRRKRGRCLAGCGCERHNGDTAPDP